MRRRHLLDKQLHEMGTEALLREAMRRLSVQEICGHIINSHRWIECVQTKKQPTTGSVPKVQITEAPKTKIPKKNS